MLNVPWLFCQPTIIRENLLVGKIFLWKFRNLEKESKNTVLNNGRGFTSLQHGELWAGSDQGWTWVKAGCLLCGG